MPYTLSQLKEVLDGLGYNLGPDGLNGNSSNALDAFTQAAIQELQAYYQLPVSGKLDTTTDDLVKKLVRNIQYNLNIVIDAKLPVNEFYGPRTVQAVKAFQRTYGLPVTGIAGLTIRQKLCEEAKKRAIAPTYLERLAVAVDTTNPHHPQHSDEITRSWVSSSSA